MQRLKTINELASPMSQSLFITASDMSVTPVEEDNDVIIDASINVIDLVRVQTLTNMSETGMDDVQKKKTQRLFQASEFIDCRTVL